MSTAFFTLNSQSILRVRAGTLAPHIDGFAGRLATNGYARFTVRQKLTTVSDLGGWLKR